MDLPETDQPLKADVDTGSSTETTDVDTGSSTETPDIDTGSSTERTDVDTGSSTERTDVDTGSSTETPDIDTGSSTETTDESVTEQSTFGADGIVEQPKEEEDVIDTDFEMSLPIDEAVVEKLTYGTLEKCLPSLQKGKSFIEEVLQNQNVLLETMQHENEKFSECKAFEELSETMIQAKKYYIKLMNIKKEMASVQDRSHRLKKRAVKLQQQKQKEEFQRAHQQERELERERMLTAKVAKKSAENTPS